MNFKLKWMQLPDKFCDLESSKFVILPISYEKDLTYGKGAARGAVEIIDASAHLEYFDAELRKEYFEKGVFVNSVLDLSALGPEMMVSKIQESVVSFGSSKFVIALGGDHAVSIGLVKGLEKRHGDFAILQIDAHSDFRDSWNGSGLNHACVMRRIVGGHEIVAVGIRSQDKDERLALDANSNVQTIYGWDFSLDKVKSALLKVKSEKLYITIDVDGFDPSIISCTGTPEPGGLLWKQVIEILKLCFSLKEVISCDVVEFAPCYNEFGRLENQSRVEAYILARLVSKMMGLAK
jgi:agmatinase